MQNWFCARLILVEHLMVTPTTGVLIYIQRIKSSLSISSASSFKENCKADSIQLNSSVPNFGNIESWHLNYVHDRVLGQTGVMKVECNYVKFVRLTKNYSCYVRRMHKSRTHIHQSYYIEWLPCSSYFKFNCFKNNLDSRLMLLPCYS